MAVALLRSQDCLKGSGFSPSAETLVSRFKHERRNPNHNANPNRSSSRSVRQRNRSPSDSESERSNSKSNSKDLVVKFPAKNLVMEQVKILKRGEDFKSSSTTTSDFKSSSTTTSDQKAVEQKAVEKKAVDQKNKVLPKDRRSGEEKLKLKVTSKRIEDDESKLFSANRFGPEPDMVPKQINFTEVRSVKDDAFAGSAELDKVPKQIEFTKVRSVMVKDAAFAGSTVITSPSPSSLPLPAFFTKKVAGSSDVDNVATKSLCQLLGLNLL